LQRQPATAIRDSRKTAQKVKSLTASVLQALMKFHWPGNVRELENLIERLVVLNQKDELDVADLPPEYRELRRLTSTVDDDADIKNYQDALREKRIEIIRNALVHTTGNQTAAAKLLKIQPSYLCKMIKDLGMRE
jgi:transcriptional regulator with PAS, ATPase and Fis domain